MSSSPEILGDPTRESADQLTRRQERMIISVCRSVADILKRITEIENDAKCVEFIEEVSIMMQSDSFYKATFFAESKKVRQAAFELAIDISRLSDKSPNRPISHIVASHVFNSIEDRNVPILPASLSAVLSLVSSCPEVWSMAGDLKKVFLPRLVLALKTGGGKDQPETVFRAVLPILSLLPDGTMDFSLYDSVLKAMWQGALAVPQGDSSAFGAIIESFVEVFTYAVTNHGIDISDLTLEILNHVISDPSSSPASMEHATAAVVTQTLDKLDRCKNSFAMQYSRSIGHILETTTKIAVHKHAAQCLLPPVELLIMTMSHHLVVDREKGSSCAIYLEEMIAPSLKLILSMPAEYLRQMCLLHSESDYQFCSLLSASLEALPCLGDDDSYSPEDEMLRKVFEWQIDGLISRCKREDYVTQPMHQSCRLMASCLRHMDYQRPCTFYSALKRMHELQGPALALTFVRYLSRVMECNLLASTDLDRFSVYLASHVAELDASALLECLFVGGDGSSFLSAAGQLSCLGQLISAFADDENESKLKVASFRLVQLLILSGRIVMKEAYEEIFVVFVFAFDSIVSGTKYDHYVGKLVTNEIRDTSDIVDNQVDDLVSISRDLWENRRIMHDFLSVLDSDHYTNFILAIVNTLRSLGECSMKAVSDCAFVVYNCFQDFEEIAREFLWQLSDPNTTLALSRAFGFEKIFSVIQDSDFRDLVVEIITIESSEYQLNQSLDNQRSVFLPQLVSKEKYLEEFLAYLEEAETLDVLEALLRIAGDLNKDWVAGYCEKRFNALSIDSEKDLRMLFHLVKGCASSIRQDEALLRASGLSNFTASLCTHAVFAEDKKLLKLLEIISGCLPIIKLAYKQELCLHKQVLKAGSFVWYKNASSIWESAVIVGVDETLSPPSYEIQLHSGQFRGTERHRLRVRVGDDGRHDHCQFSTQNREPNPTIFSAEVERSSLIQLGRHLLEHGNIDVKSASKLFLATLVYGADFLCDDDWKNFVTWMEASMYECNDVTTRAMQDFADVLRRECGVLSDMQLGDDMKAILDFLRRIKRKAILEKSERGREVFNSISSAFHNTLQVLSEQLGVADAILEVYCMGLQDNSADVQQSWKPVVKFSKALETAAIGMFMQVGRLEAMASTCGLQVAFKHLKAWANLEVFTYCFLENGESHSIREVVANSDVYADIMGVDTVDCLLGLAVGLMQSKVACYVLMKDVHCLGRLMAVSEISDSETAFEGSRDALDCLENAGMHPELAKAILSRHHWLGWALVLAYLMQDGGHRMSADTVVHTRRQVLKIEHCLKCSQDSVHLTLDEIIEHLPLWEYVDGKKSRQTTPLQDISYDDYVEKLRKLCVPWKEKNIEANFLCFIYGGILCTFPVLCRSWYADIRDRQKALAIEKLTAAVVTPAIVEKEFSSVHSFSRSLHKDSRGVFHVKVLQKRREICAKLDIEDGRGLELDISLPPSFPLLPPEVRCQKSVGISESRLRKWMLSMTVFLRNRNGDLLDSLKLWRQNVEGEFEGHEECLICYSIVQVSNGQLPKLGCRTCHKKFHGACLYKWFSSSGKNTCPHCQSPW